MSYKIRAACGCNVGKIRKNNEDNLYFNHVILPEENPGLEDTLSMECDLSEKSAVFGVFDGMGGEADGQIASFLAAQILQNHCEELMASDDDIQKNYDKLIEQMNEAVYRAAEDLGNRMGCTAAMLLLSEKGLYLCNVGDSPIFWLHDQKMEQISLDHTDADFLRKQGIMNRKPHLTQCIGISPEEMRIVPYLYEEKLSAGDRYLICSDGLTDMVSIDEIQRILTEIKDLKACADTLVQKALEGGGKDNITVIVIETDGEQMAEDEKGLKEHKMKKSPNKVMLYSILGFAVIIVIIIAIAVMILFNPVSKSF